MDHNVILYMTNLFKWANVFISLFIILIAYSFFQRTKPHNNRTPWIILFIAVIMFFVFELSNAVFPDMNPIPELRDFFKTLFVAFILYVFVYENYLIKHASKIIIERKEDITKTNSQIPANNAAANPVPAETNSVQKQKAIKNKKK